MAGDHSCEWAPWFKSHFQGYAKAESDFDSATWKTHHTRLLRETRIRHESAGKSVLVESQNSFRLTLAEEHLVLAGQPDLVVLGDREGVVVDAKTGKPRPSDELQVMLYMWAFPRARVQIRGLPMDGLVVYGDHDVPISRERLDARFLDDLDYFMKVLGSREPAHRVPSWSNCRFCDIAKNDCSVRVESAAGE
jgi:hypothetical protein